LDVNRSFAIQSPYQTTKYLGTEFEGNFNGKTREHLKYFNILCIAKSYSSLEVYADSKYFSKRQEMALRKRFEKWHSTTSMD